MFLLLQALLGPFCTLNLRNLLWHGFVAPSELHPCYASFMVLLLLNAGAHAAQRIDPSDIKWDDIADPHAVSNGAQHRH